MIHKLIRGDDNIRSPLSDITLEFEKESGDILTSAGGQYLKVGPILETHLTHLRLVYQ